MKLHSFIGAVVLSASLAACAYSARPHCVKPAASFSQELNSQYSHLATFETEPYYDATDAAYYRSKAWRAVHGVDVQPENPETWNVPRELRPEMDKAYDALQIALVPDRKKVTSPVNAADAQSSYDCWVEQAQEKWVKTGEYKACRANFYDAMCRMYNGECQGKKLVMMDNIFRVYFATNKYGIDAKGHAAIAQAVAAYKSGAHEVIVAGHADRQGKSGYNLKLSERRAAAVKGALVRAGIPSRMINGKYFGEEQPLVPTPDNVPNANNRRVLIVVR